MQNSACKIFFVASGLSLTAFLHAAPAKALVTVYFNQSSFLSAIAGSSSNFTDDFSNLAPNQVYLSPLIRSGSNLSVAYSAPGPDANELYTMAGSLSANHSTNSLLLTLGPDVYAAGGNFYQGSGGNVVPGRSMSVTASNGVDPDTTITHNPSSISDFYGWISTSPLKTLTTSTGSNSIPSSYPTIDSMTLSNMQKTPSPSAPVPLPIVGTLGAFTIARRLRCRVAAAQLIHKES